MSGQLLYGEQGLGEEEATGAILSMRPQAASKLAGPSSNYNSQRGSKKGTASSIDEGKANANNKPKAKLASKFP